MWTSPEGVRAWGRHAHGSPLYAHLVDVIAGDEELMRILHRIEYMPQVNLILGSVHFMLLRGADGQLAAWYASLVEDPLPVNEVDPVFRAFLREHEEEVVQLANTHYTQTNECRRCIALLPAVMGSPHARFHLIEIGTSAGLNLALDRYRYDFGNLQWGPDSTVVLEGEWRGRRFPLREIEVLSRIGLDLNPILPEDVEAQQWLDALIWPEQKERRARLRDAMTLVSSLTVELVEGDALETLPAVMDRLPSGDPAVVMNAFTFGQLTPEGRDRVEEICDTERAKRPVFRVSLELLANANEWARLSTSNHGPLVQIGQAHPHGEWVEFWDQARP
jgi:hypothetical protein